MADPIGRLDRIITLQVRAQSQNQYGEQVATFTDDQTLRAELVEFYGGTTGKEEYDAMQQTPLTEIVFRIRYKSKLNASDYRIKYNGEVFNINQVKEDIEGYRRQYMKLLCDAR